MEFDEVRGGKTIGYWVSYVSRFGLDHLINPTHNISFVQLYDLDIKVLFCVGMLLCYLILKKILKCK